MLTIEGQKHCACGIRKIFGRYIFTKIEKKGFAMKNFINLAASKWPLKKTV